jgi:hypothetical protein
MVVAVLFLAGCAGQRPQMTAAEGRALIAAHLPSSLSDKDGWAADIYTPMVVLELPLTPDNICAIVSVTEQESSFRADPAVPNLNKLAWAEIERQRERLGVPSIALDAALSIKSKTGASYRQRIDEAKTERHLSDVFEEMIDRVPLGRTFFAHRNPVRTGGPMQVSVAFAIEHAKQKRYPYPVVESIRDEVFTRRGGMYFGIAHLLDYPAPYDRYRYRYADFNAGHYAKPQRRVPGGARAGLGTEARAGRRPGARRRQRDAPRANRGRRAFDLARAGHGSGRDPARPGAGKSPTSSDRALPARVRAGGRAERQARAAARGARDRAAEREVHAKADHGVVRGPRGRSPSPVPGETGGNDLGTHCHPGHLS